jgi:hypothetical protein
MLAERSASYHLTDRPSIEIQALLKAASLFAGALEIDL